MLGGGVSRLSALNFLQGFEFPLMVVCVGGAFS